MKTMLSALVCSFFLVQLFAFNNIEDNKGENNTSSQSKERVEYLITQQFASKKAILLLNEDKTLRLQSNQTHKNNHTTYKYKQFYKSLPVEGSSYFIRSKDSEIINTTGKLIKQIEIDVKPVFSPNEAIQFAIKSLNHNSYAWQDPHHQQLIKKVRKDNSASFYPDAELVIIDPSFQNTNNNFRLAYKIDIYSIEPLSRQIIYVDAQNGNILKSIEKIHYCTEEKITCTGNYSGTVEIDVCSEDGELILKNNIGGGMQVYNANNTKENPNIIITDEGVNFSNDGIAVDVHYGTQQVDAYFRSIHNHFGIDNSDSMAYLSWVHFGNNFNHAFWNGNWMTYGDGDDSIYNSLTSLDLVAHEIVHGIIDFSSELFYINESGALNESFADFFGEVIETWVNGSNDWIFGAEIVAQEGIAGIRNLSNPNDDTMIKKQPNTYKGNFWYDGYADHGGVHINSGVHNYMLYLLTEGGSGTNDHGYNYNVTGLGMEKVAAMAYECMTTLPSNAGFYDARNNFIQIARSLYGDSNEVNQVKEAYAAVGIYDCKERDKAALIALYNALDGPNWVNTWNITGDYTEWYGVKVNEFGCVTCLDLDGLENFQHDADSIPNGNGLSGELPTEIGLLKSLDSLILSNNNLTGNIPLEIGNLDSLQHLWIDFNQQLDETIPESLGNLENLITLFLYGNSLSGSIPYSIGNLKKLDYLFLGNNNLTGDIPAEIGNLTNLIKLDLADNSLTGKIPGTFANLTRMIEWWTANNQLSGCFHADLKSLCSQNEEYPFNPGAGNNFDITWQQFCNEDLGICEPSNTIDSLTLIKLWQATGGENWTIKWDLNTSYKNWYGIQTDTEGNVTSIDLDGNDDGIYSPNGNGNNLTGFIPNEIGNLSDLNFLCLSGNSLTENIPREISYLEALESLILSNNALTGNISHEFSTLINLNELRLDNNNLGDCFYESLETLCGLVNTISIDENNNFDVLWDDFCNNGLGYCGGEFVLPGDFNGDGSITSIDLLFWGNAFGREGFERPDATNVYIPQLAPKWESAADGINDKHKDADGNGIVDNSDVQVFIDNINENNSNTKTVEATFKDSQIKIDLVPVDTIYEANKIRVVFEIKVQKLDGTPFNGYGYACGLDFGDLKVYEASLTVDKNSSFNLKHYENLDPINNVFDFVMIQTSFNNTPINQNNARIIILVENIIDSTFRQDIAVSYVSAGNNGIDGFAKQVIPVSTSSNVHITKGNLNAKVSIIHKQKTNLAQASIKVSGGNGPYNFEVKGHTNFNQIKNDSIVIDSLYEGRYITEISDANNNTITIPIYVDGSNSVCKQSIELSTPVQNSELFTKITWNDIDALLQYKAINGESWITVLDYDGEAILDLDSGEYQIRSKYPCINSDIYSDTLTITIVCSENCSGDKTAPEVTCPTENNQNNCSPTFIPQPLELIDFDVMDDNTPTDSILFNVDTIITNRPNFTIYNYTYSFTDKASNTSFCEEQYIVANEILQAPVVDDFQVSCQDKLWCFDQIGKYHFYINDRGMPGNLLFSIENNPNSVCSNVDLNIDTSIPKLYNLWVTELKTFPDGSICESDPTPFSLNVYPKPIATLKETNKIVKLDPINLMDLIEDNKSGYWTGENVITVPDPLLGDITYFHATEPGKTKLYYTVKNEYCSQSYLLVIIATYSENFKIYPNPATEQAHIQFDEKINAQNITIYNIDGRVVKYLDVNTQNNIAIDVSYLKKGIYLIKIKTAQSSSIQKLFIE